MPCSRWNSKGRCDCVAQAQHIGNGVRIVGRELRIDERRIRGKQAAGAGQVRHVGVYLARVHRIGRKPTLLRALDLAVPVGALHQAQVETASAAPRQRDQPVHDRRRAPLIGLHREAEAVPPRERTRFHDGSDNLQRQVQAIGLFRIDGHRHTAGRAMLDQRHAPAAAARDARARVALAHSADAAPTASRKCWHAPAPRRWRIRLPPRRWPRGRPRSACPHPRG